MKNWKPAGLKQKNPMALGKNLALAVESPSLPVPRQSLHKTSWRSPCGPKATEIPEMPPPLWKNDGECKIFFSRKNKKSAGGRRTSDAAHATLFAKNGRIATPARGVQNGLRGHGVPPRESRAQKIALWKAFQKKVFFEKMSGKNEKSIIDGKRLRGVASPGEKPLKAKLQAPPAFLQKCPLRKKLRLYFSGKNKIALKTAWLPPPPPPNEDLVTTAPLGLNSRGKNGQSWTFLSSKNQNRVKVGGPFENAKEFRGLGPRPPQQEKVSLSLCFIQNPFLPKPMSEVFFTTLGANQVKTGTAKR